MRSYKAATSGACTLRQVQQQRTISHWSSGGAVSPALSCRYAQRTCLDTGTRRCRASRSNRKGRQRGLLQAVRTVCAPGRIRRYWRAPSCGAAPRRAFLRRGGVRGCVSATFGTESPTPSTLDGRSSAAPRCATAQRARLEHGGHDIRQQLLLAEVATKNAAEVEADSSASHTAEVHVAALLRARDAPQGRAARSAAPATGTSRSTTWEGVAGLGGSSRAVSRPSRRRAAFRAPAARSGPPPPQRYRAASMTCFSKR